MTGDDGRSRRDLLATGVTALTVGLAGCPGTDVPPATKVGHTPTSAPIPWPTDTPDSSTALFVAPDGRERADGTRDDPLASLSNALERVEPGETVVLRGGTYRPDRAVDVRGVSGTRETPIRIVPAAGERPVYDFSDAERGGLRFSGCDWLDVVGVTIRRAPSRGLLVEGGSDNVAIRGVTVRDCGGDPEASGTGVFVLDSVDVTLRSVVSTGNYDPSSGGNNADGIDVENASGSVVESCVAAGNSDDGIDLWESTDVTVRDCLAFDNGWRPDGSSGGDGDGFKLGGGGRSGDNRIVRCVAHNNRTRGFDDNSASRPLTLYNCTAWNNSVNYRLGCQVDQGAPNCPTHVLRNNLSHEGLTVFSPSVDSRRNSWDLDVDDPEFASTDPSDSDFLHLTAGSPVIDAGVDVGLPFEGARPDLGAFEFDGS